MCRRKSEIRLLHPMLEAGNIGSDIQSRLDLEAERLKAMDLSKPQQARLRPVQHLLSPLRTHRHRNVT